MEYKNFKELNKMSPEEKSNYFCALMREKAQMCEEMAKNRHAVEAAIDAIAPNKVVDALCEALLCKLSDKAIPAKSNGSVFSYEITLWGDQRTENDIQKLSESLPIITAMTNDKKDPDQDPFSPRRITVTMDISGN